jgi:hypothetical protein
VTGPTPLEPLRRLPSRPPEGVLFSQSPGRYLREITARSMPRRVLRQGHPVFLAALLLLDFLILSLLLVAQFSFFLQPINSLQSAAQPHSFLLG